MSRSSTGLLRVVAAVLVVSLAAACAPPAWTPPAGSPYPAQLTDPSSAEGYVLGSIWGDGFDLGGVAAFSTGSATIAGSVVKAAGIAGWRAVALTGATGKIQVRFPDVPFASVGHDGVMPGLDRDADDRRLVAFLVGVIQSEGGARDGLVLDDPSAERARAMSAMLQRLGLAHRVEGERYFRVYLEPAAWPVLRTWPFVVWGRVPGVG